MLKTAQRTLGSCMRLLVQCLRTIVPQVTPALPATIPQRWLNQWNIKDLQIHCCSLVSYLVTASHMAIVHAPFLNIKLSSGSWYLIWASAPAPGQMPSSSAPSPQPNWACCEQAFDTILDIRREVRKKHCLKLTCDLVKVNWLFLQ